MTQRQKIRSSPFGEREPARQRERLKELDKTGIIRFTDGHTDTYRRIWARIWADGRSEGIKKRREDPIAAVPTEANTRNKAVTRQTSLLVVGQKGLCQRTNRPTDGQTERPT